MSHRTRTALAAAGACIAVLLGLAAPAGAPAQPAGAASSVRPPAPLPPRHRPPLIVVRPAPEARLPVELASVAVETRVAGDLARTRMEVVLRNPNDRVLEGELQFPLQEGQSVTGFALDIDGRLRDAVAVPKAKGRQVFDDVTRQRVDPALLSATQGTGYKLRVYPLPARGTRRVVLHLLQTLPGDAATGAHTLRLPLAYGMRVGELALDVRVADGRAPRGGLRRQALPAETRPDGERVVSLRRSGFEGDDELVLELPGRGGATPLVTTEEFRGKTYAAVDLPVGAVRAVPRPVPRTLGLVWDASGSAATRDRAAELALLGAYLRRVRDTTVVLKVVRDTAEPERRFEVRGGDWAALRHALESAPLDGATAGALLAPPAGADLTLLFTDGLANYGEAAWPAPAQPLVVLASGRVVERDTWRRIAEASGGAFVDLGASSREEALARLRMHGTRVVALEGDGIGELQAASLVPQRGIVRLAGVMTRPEASVTVRLRDGSGHERVVTQRLVHGDGSAPSARVGVAAGQWARLRLAALAGQETLHGAEIERLGMHFSMVTPRTSLIVLDAAADYARHGIEPPASEPALAAEVQRLAAARRDTRARNAEAWLAMLRKDFAERSAWWDKDFPKDERPAPPKAVPRGAGAATAASPEAAREQAEREARTEQERRASMASRTPAPGMPAPMAPPAPVAAPSPPPPPAPGAAPQAGTARIALQRWLPDNPAAQRLRAAAPEQAYAVYLDERRSNEHATAFFLDAAEILAAKGQPALARRVLSNLAEMNLEDRAILRILAYRLLQDGDAAAARPLLERVLALAPDEPQSWRDLGLAHAALGDAQRAVDHLWHVARTPWDGRFMGISLIALAELNEVAAKAARAGRPVDLAALPPELVRPLPVALRVVLAWDADNTDIDLWVTDPNGEKAYYGHRLTWQGGRMSRDLTGGYGPEEFVLKAPKPGRYTVQAKFYGHRQQIVAPATTLMLQLTTDFGSDGERSENTVVRLSGAGQTVDIGSFEVKAPAP